MIDIRPSIALYQPDIAGNTGTLLRLAACTATELHIIEPAGFRLDDKALRRAGMDYAELASLTRHLDWSSFCSTMAENDRRIVLLTTRADRPYVDFEFSASDILLLGRESSGVPEEIHQYCGESLTIPMAENTRSINLALAGAMVLGEALRQTGR
ncbi:MAG: tRNA (cytidine(34)-2'-O)-methyltransferase [Pseudomonadota bacterium]